MTLSKQILISVWVILLGLFLGMSYFTLNNTEKFVQNQLSQNAQDTANSLGLSLSISLKGNNLPTAKRIIDALFDSGYYQNIKMVSTNGVVLIDLVNDEDVYNVPDWFEKIIHITPPIKQAVVLDGWQQLGKIYVQCHPGFAYQKIYENLKDGLLWLILFMILVAVVGYMMLFILLKPLREVRKQANLITKKNFYIIKNTPWASDLKEVVLAMNQLSVRLKKFFEKQERVARHFQDKAYQDSLTGLKNKLWLSHQFYLLRKKGESGKGLFIILELSNFKSYNEKFSRAAGDKVLIQAARLLENTFKFEFSAVITRTEGASFAIMLFNKTAADAQRYALEIPLLFKQFTQIEMSGLSDIGHAGMVLFDYSDVKSNIVKKANQALTDARFQAANNCLVYEQTQQDNEEKLRTDTQWKKIFDNTIKNNKFECHFEPVVFYQYPENHYLEALARLQLSEGDVIAAREWIYAARRLQMIHAVDLMIFIKVIEKITTEANKNNFYFINLSSDTLLKPFYPEDMLNRLSAVGQLKENIIIELSEYDLLQHLALLKPILVRFIQAGLKLSIDQFGANVTQLHYLHELEVHYIKIDPNFTQKLDTHAENQILVKTFIDMAHSVKAKVIAKNVENKQDALILQKLGMDAMMGNFIS